MLQTYEYAFQSSGVLWSCRHRVLCAVVLLRCKKITYVWRGAIFPTVFEDEVSKYEILVRYLIFIELGLYLYVLRVQYKYLKLWFPSAGYK